MRRLLLALLLVAAPASGVTRIHFGSTTTTGGTTPDTFTGCTPAADGGWEDTSQLLRAVMTAGSVLPNRHVAARPRTINLTTSSPNQDLDTQYLMRIASGVTFTSGSTTVTAQLPFSENGSLADVNQVIMGIRIIDDDCSTVNATLLAVANYGTTTEGINSANTVRNKTAANGDAVTATYTTVTGDWLVIELGLQNDGATGGSSGNIGVSDGSGFSLTLSPPTSTTAADCPVDETTQDCAGWVEFSNTFTQPLDAGPARRLYLPASGAADVSPAASGWDETSEAQYFEFNYVKGSSSLAAGQTVDSVGNQLGTDLDRVYVTDEMPAGIVFTQGQTTVSGQLMARELTSTDELVGLALHIRIVSSDGTTIRSEFFANPLLSGYTELDSTAVRNHSLVRGVAMTGATYTTVSGDRIAAYIGFTQDMSATGGISPQGVAQYGEDASDCAVGFTGTGCAGWLEFSNNPTFSEEATSLPRPPFFGRALLADPITLARRLMRLFN